MRIITQTPKRIKKVSSKSFAKWSVFTMVKRMKTWTEASLVLKILVDWLQFRNTRPLQLHIPELNNSLQCPLQCASERLRILKLLERLLSFGSKLTAVLFEKNVKADNIPRAIKKRMNSLKWEKTKPYSHLHKWLILSSCRKNDTLTIVPYRCPSLFVRSGPSRYIFGLSPGSVSWLDRPFC